ncbi:MAG TPA: VTT domain-containing protein [Candidatus Eisenbacteria bacterium]|nr:VTT domain-containing protein [Candidatus Eisenbacteria bacterium]
MPKAKQGIGRKTRRRKIVIAVAILIVLFGLAAAWKWTPLADQIDIRKIAAWAFSLRDNPAREMIILAAYLVGSLIMVPITVLIVATALVFGPTLGSAYSLAGCLIGSAATYAVGYFLGRDFVRQITGPKWERVEAKIGQAGIVAVATLRLIPVAPFTIVNVISGAFQVPIRDYFVGSVLGLAPGILVINLFAHQTVSAIRNPGWGSYLLLAALVVVSALGLLWVRRRVGQIRV